MGAGPYPFCMPIYEYVAKEDGAVIELLRPMIKADDAVQDPEGRGRTFRRIASTFAAQGSGPSAGGKSAGGASAGGCCPCGKGAGACKRA